MKALLILTDTAATERLQLLLAPAGCEVRHCATFIEARALAEQLSPELLFLHFEAPLEPSLEFCLWFRSVRAGVGAWIVGLLANADPQSVRRVMAAGVDDLLIRPLQEEPVQLRLLTALRQVQKSRTSSEERLTESRRGSVTAQQQAALAALGQCALVGVSLDTIIRQALTFVAETMEADRAAAFEFLEREEVLQWIDGVGWTEDCPERLRLAIDTATAEGLALRRDPAWVPDWNSERELRKAFDTPGKPIQCSLVVSIPAPRGAFGILAVYSTRPQAFLEEDANFLKAAAIVLSLAVERHRSERANQQLAAFARCNPNPVLELEVNGQLVYANSAARDMAQTAGLSSVSGLLPEHYPVIARTCLELGEAQTSQVMIQGRKSLAWSFFPVGETRTVHGYAEEVTDRLELETQLRQLQKMECVGQLAAGLAHDFNNVLTIIRGHTDLVLLDQSLPERKVASLKKINGAAERASGLTRQLLAFSRRQVMQPVPMDLNEGLSVLTKMLDRVLGDQITLQFEPAPNLPPVLGDAGMLDQVTTNLAVNARDAMPKGGKLVITTSFVEVDRDHVRRRPEARLGRFACLAVTDTGCGMDAATLSRIFEPFFTTKAPDKGTGLGLATVYGIVKQHEGWIEVVSQVSKGTTFLIFLPCSGEGSVSVTAVSSSSVPPEGGAETILVVEDEPALRELARMMLQRYGYRVLEADSGEQALKLWQRQKDRIDLLLTDMTLPGDCGGAELSERLLAEKPTLKVIFTSGYSQEILADESVRNRGLFLQKPFTAASLAGAIRESFTASQSTTSAAA